MIVTLSPLSPAGTIAAIPSKSHVHRLLIAASFVERETVIRCDRSNADIDATVRALNALGAHIAYHDGRFSVRPIRTPVDGATLDVGESGSTLRFLVPVVAALGVTAHFQMRGRLPERPLSPMKEALERHGITFSGKNPLTVSGKLTGGDFTFDGGISSQFTTGLLLAMPCMTEPASVTLTGKIESRPYIALTIQTLRTFGYTVSATDNRFAVTGRAPHTPSICTAEGDWSNGAYPLALGALSGGGVTVTGLDSDSTQGDRAILSLIERFGGQMQTCADGSILVRRGNMTGVAEIRCEDTPDLVPILAVLAASAVGETVLAGCGRLRLKESDRIASVCAMITSLGGDIRVSGDDIHITGTGTLRGGTVDGCNDHRIVMAAAVAAVITTEPVTIRGAEAVAKSYPGFFADLGTLCGIQIGMKEEQA